MNELKLQTDALKKKENEIFFHERRLALIKAENLKYAIYASIFVDVNFLLLICWYSLF